MALDWKKAGLAALNPMAAANVSAIKEMAAPPPEKGMEEHYESKGLGGMSGKERRLTRRADRGSVSAASKLEQIRLADEAAAATGKAEQTDVDTTFGKYQEQIAAGEQAAVRELVEAEGGRMGPGGKMRQALQTVGEATKEKLAAGYASIKEVMDKAAALKKQNLRTLLFARGDAELAQQMQMVAMVSSMLSAGMGGLSESVAASPTATTPTAPAPTPVTPAAGDISF